jgi:putative transcriptional regulator
MSSSDLSWSYEWEKDKEIKAGTLILAEPFMDDENFKRTVVLICEHEEHLGSMGLVINRPLGLKVSNVIEDFPPFDGDLYLGGPVGTDTIQFVHTISGLEGSVPLLGSLRWGGDFEKLKLLIADGRVVSAQLRFFLGHSGWSPHQLREELKENSWIISVVKDSYLFHSGSDGLWKTILKDMGGLYAEMARLPENPILN